MSLYRLLLPCVLLAACVPCVGQNWPQWRGPFLNGSTTETGLPTEWSTTQGVLWVTPIGPGSSTPVVFGDKVFISDVDRATNDVVALCIDASSGKVLWLSAYCVPVTVGKVMVCVAFETAKATATIGATE